MPYVQVRKSLAPVERGAGTTNGTGIPFTDTDWGTALIVCGTIADGSHVVSFEESDAVGGTYSAVPAARVVGTLPTITNAETLRTYIVDVQAAPAKPFVRPVITTTGGTAINIIGVYFLATIGVDLPPVNSPTL